MEACMGNRLVSHEVFQKIQPLYWVLTSPYRGKNPSVFDWVCSLNVKPYPVPNQSMEWRRPTYEECIERQGVYDENPKEFVEKAAERSKKLHWYVRRAEMNTETNIGGQTNA